MEKRSDPVESRYPAVVSESYAQEPEVDPQVHLLDYWRVLAKRRAIVIASLLAVVIVVAVYTWKQMPIYRATLKLQIDNEQSSILPFRDNAVSGFAYVPTEEYLKTQFEALTSRTLAIRVVRALDLQNDRRLLGTAPNDLFSRARDRIGLKNEVRPAPTVFSLAGMVASSVTITPIKDSRVVLLNFDAPDPSLAAQVVNTLASEFIQMNFETRYKSTVSASDFLAKQLVDLKAQVEASEAQLVSFGQAHNIYSLGDRETVVVQKLADLNTKLTQAQAERIEKESIWKIVRQTPPGQFPEILRAPEIRSLESGLAQLQQQHIRLRALYKPGWPEVKQTEDQISLAEKQLTDARSMAVVNVETAYREALQRERLLSNALDEQKAEANSLNESSIQYSILKRDVESSKQIYDGLLQRMKEAAISAGLKSNNIHVVDPAEPPDSPYLPKRSANLIKGVAGGLLLGIVLAFFFEYINSYSDKSLKTPEDVERFLKLPFLGLIPSIQGSLRAVGRKNYSKVVHHRHGSGIAGRSSAEMIAHHESRSPISEAYRDLRTSVLLSCSADHGPKTILVTSSQKGEGKTTTCINLAITLAQTGEKVLLLDCDMRKPNIHQVFGLDNKDGMSVFLSRANPDSAPPIQTTPVPNLYFCSSGRIPPNPAELIGSARMKTFLSVLSEQFDHILIDSPPLLAVTDARILATFVDGVILVIKGGETVKEAVIRSKRLLRDVRARILGTMLNNVDFRASNPYYYSRYYYDSGAEQAQQEQDSHDDVA
jgi:polysaccharide biosynthesis transport protein